MTTADALTKLENRLNKHFIECAQDKVRDEIRHKQIMEELAALTKVTADVVEAWKIANGLQRFIKWLSGFALLAAALAWASKHLT